MNLTTTAPAWAKVERLDRFKRMGGEGHYTACCPAHNDRNPSLSISIGDDGEILLNCFAGCDIAAIVAALGCELHDLYEPKAGTAAKGGAPPSRQIAATYDYRDEEGDLLYQTVRYAPKDFRQRRPDDGRAGNWTWNLQGVQRVPYRLPELRSADPAAIVYLVEGEKDADRLAQLGMVVTTTAQGASSLSTSASSLAQELTGRRVVILPDADDPGDGYAAGAMKLLSDTAVAVAILHLPRLAHAPKHGEDVSDWLDKHGGTSGELRELAEAALSARVTSKRGSRSEATEDDTLPPSRIADWPDPLAEAAYIGPIGRFVKKLAPHTEAAPEALLIQALVAAGNAMGRHGYAVAEADDHHTNLFAVIVAGTGARKGTSWGHVKRHLRRADPAWATEHIVGGLSSGEGLINAVRDDDPAIPDKVALALETEFGAVFQVKGRDGNTLSAIMRQAWDGSDLRTLTRTSPLRATDTHISLIGHITADELRRLMRETDANNGFANRILWICARRARFLPNGGNLADSALNDEVRELHEALAFAKTVGELKRDRAAQSLWCERYRELSTGRPGMLGAVTGRAEAQVTRLSLIYALLDQSLDVKRCHLEAALAVWDYCLASARFLFGAALGDVLAEKLYKLLCEAGAEGTDRTEMHRQLGNNVSADDIARALGLLAGQGMAQKRREVGDGGRSMDRWYAITYEFNEDNELSDMSGQRKDVLDSLNSLNSYAKEEPASDGDHRRMPMIPFAERVAQLNAQGIHGDAAVRRALAERGTLPPEGVAVS